MIATQYYRERDRLLSLDLLRAVAALGVFIFHASSTAGFDKFKLMVYSPFSGTNYYIPNFFSLGATGVSLFFVISGYCLSRSWFRNNADRINLNQYYVNRLSRVYPAYFFSLVITLLIWIFLDGWSALTNPYSDGRPSLLLDFGSHALFLHGFSNRSFLSFNGTLWSMATEVQFYLLLPVVYILMARFGHRVMAALTLVLCLLVRYTSELSADLTAPVVGGVSDSVLISYSSLGRLFEFAIGMAIASAESKKEGNLKVPILVVVLLMSTSAFLRWIGAGWIADPSWGISFGMLLVWTMWKVDANKSMLLEKFRGVRGLQKLGLYSYSFFLIHWAALLLSGRLVWNLGSVGWTRFFIEGTSCFLISFYAAKWMYINIETNNSQMLGYVRKLLPKNA